MEGPIDFSSTQDGNYESVKPSQKENGQQGNSERPCTEQKTVSLLSPKSLPIVLVCVQSCMKICVAMCTHVCFLHLYVCMRVGVGVGGCMCACVRARVFACVCVHIHPL